MPEIRQQVSKLVEHLVTGSPDERSAHHSSEKGRPQLVIEPPPGEKEVILRLKIVQAGEPVLRQTARPLTTEEILSDEIQRLIRDMKETMYDAPGVGLAAPQVGLPLQLAVIEDREDLLKALPAQEIRDKERRPVPFHVVINPRIISMGGDKVDFHEGCLSLTGFSAVVSRARTVQVEYLDERGEHRSVEASGWYARILQHEIDHLQGTLYIDRMHSRTFTSIDNWNRFWKGRPVPGSSADVSST